VIPDIEHTGDLCAFGGIPGIVLDLTNLSIFGKSESGYVLTRNNTRGVACHGYLFE
jgi:hypothetical protein